MMTHHRDQRGGAVVEFGVFTFVFVPLALYGAWFADALHLGIKAQEASMVPVWDVTSHLLHDSSGGGGTSKYNPAIQKAVSDIQGDMANSFDSTDPSGSPTRASVLVKADPLSISCQQVSAPNADADWTTSPSMALGWKATMDADKRPTDTWVACRSVVTLHTTGFQPDFAETQASGLKLLANNLLNIKLCGIGPGFNGCGSNGPADGFKVMNDDWGLEYGQQNGLNPGSADGNQPYFDLAKEYFTAAGSPGYVSMIVGGFGDQGATTSFRLTYRRGSEGAFDATESQHGQDGPHGGPSQPHTGGAWHEENSAHQDVSEKTFNSARVAAHYLGVKAFPADGT